jgi:tripartite-type tricarboxylate transporter receptor subunit TctC
MNGIARFAFALNLMLAVPCSASSTLAAGYPDGPITIVVGYGPGGGSDIVARMLTDGMQKALGQPVVVENRPGAGTTIAARHVANAAPDGYTIEMATSAHTVAATSKLEYDPLENFAPIIFLGRQTEVVAVNPNVKAQTLKEFIELARSQPGKLNFGSSGAGTFGWLEMRDFLKAADLDLVGLSYDSGPATATALLGGEIDVMLGSATAVKGLVDKLRALAVTGSKRSELFPDLPTITEATGIPFDIGGAWYGVLAPAGTPADIVEKLRSAIESVLMSDAVQAKLKSQGFVTDLKGPQEFHNIIKLDIDTWTALIRETGAN